jgi:hypothetical protein
MLALSFRKKVTKSVEIASEPCGEFPPDGTSLSDDRIIHFSHGLRTPIRYRSFLDSKNEGEAK